MDTLRFYFVTWNVATKSPGQDLNALLDFPSQYNKNKPLPDFYIIGLQEVKSQPQNMLMDCLFTDPWTSSFNKILCSRGFIIAKSIRLQGILLLVYTQLKHVTHLRDLEAQYTKTGLGGMWGNKGAVSVRFNIYGCSFCLVNCHLTAHEHLLADRIGDYNTIIKQHDYHVAETTNILYHDYVFWIGDLNFRTDYPSNESPSSEEIVATLKKIEKDKYQSLLRHDQLLAVMESGDAFSEFSEPEIHFPPTYKYFAGSDDYDVKRKPSWTDRILYKVVANNYENITLRAHLLSYHHVPHYTVSDHKPVVAQYNVKVANHLVQPKVPRSAIRMRSLAVAMSSTAEIVPESSTVVDGPETNNAHVAPTSTVAHCNAWFSSFINVMLDSVTLHYRGMLQAFSNYTVKTVEFAPITRIWYIGDADFRTHCTLSPDVEVNSTDWIGIYDADFQNLDHYISYEYLEKVSVSTAPAPGQPRTVTLSFPVGSGVRTPGFYRFIYFSQPSNEVRSVLGISEPFEVSSKEDRLVSLDHAHQMPSTSSSPGKPKPTTATSDLFTDFTGLDVAKLSRHFSNDLSID